MPRYVVTVVENGCSRDIVLVVTDDGMYLNGKLIDWLDEEQQYLWEEDTVTNLLLDKLVEHLPSVVTAVVNLDDNLCTINTASHIIPTCGSDLIYIDKWYDKVLKK